MIGAEGIAGLEPPVRIGSVTIGVVGAVTDGTGVCTRVPFGVFAFIRVPSFVSSKLIGRSSAVPETVPSASSTETWVAISEASQQRSTVDIPLKMIAMPYCWQRVPSDMSFMEAT